MIGPVPDLEDINVPGVKFDTDWSSGSEKGLCLTLTHDSSLTLTIVRQCLPNFNPIKNRSGVHHGMAY